MANKIFSKIRDLFFRREAATTTAATPRTGGSWNNILTAASADDAMKIATVFRCVRLLSESVANLPLRYQVRRDDIFQEDTTSQLHYLLTVQPDKAYNAFDFWVDAVQQMLLYGNAYIVPVISPVTMDYDRLVLCARRTVSHDIYTDTYTVNDLINGISGTFGEDEIIHLRNMSLDGKSGLSTLTYAAMTTGIARTGDSETLSRFSNGGNVRGIVSNDTTVRGYGEYEDEQLSKTARSINERLNLNGENIVSLPGQVDFKQTSLSSVDMQFLESRKFTVREICRFFGVHPSFVFDDTSSNYKSAEMANVAFLSNTLNPILRKIECELQRKLLTQKQCCNRRFEFDRRGLYACDLESKADYQTKTLANGTYTINEWRQEENKKPIEGGNTLMVSANLKSVNEITATAQPAEVQKEIKTPKKNEKKADKA